ncbi:hypothetical protein LTR56_003476 [Elasticomyces elasticus]|nr:hypothetical protein LTR22_010952 [Elasticomyces elasticus]KAK3655469.1 hypothetical protein LTR56_003476 [Elasticomyces elasticus]KAK4919894.1 hypothetical protein LTR49_012491 [Elasticomyces elasticus]KAK5756724.1 hypothetical protein LTS12_013188 [Elasticomyces elasticus]
MVAQLFAGEPPHPVDQDLLALGPLERHVRLMQRSGKSTNKMSGERAFTPAEGSDPLHIDDSLRPPTDLPTERRTGAGGTSGLTTDVKPNATALAGVMAATGWSPNSISITRHLQQLKRHAATELSEVDVGGTESSTPYKKPKAGGGAVNMKPPSKKSKRKTDQSDDNEQLDDADDAFM